MLKTTDQVLNDINQHSKSFSWCSADKKVHYFKSKEGWRAYSPFHLKLPENFHKTLSEAANYAQNVALINHISFDATPVKYENTSYYLKDSNVYLHNNSEWDWCIWSDRESKQKFSISSVKRNWKSLKKQNVVEKAGLQYPNPKIKTKRQAVDTLLKAVEEQKAQKLFPELQTD